MKKINYPYIINSKPYKYVKMSNPFMIKAMEVAKSGAFDTGYEPKTPVGVVFVKDNNVLISGSNGSDYHSLHGCERVKIGIPSGQRYDLCPGCDYSNHAEPKAIKKSLDLGISLNGSDAYLFGEWWCCEPCSNAMLDAGISSIYLLEDSDLYFNRGLETCRNGDFEFFKSLSET